MPLTRKRVIFDRDGVRPYMVRLHLLFREKSDHLERNVKVPFNAYIHKILLSDEPILHDHPWNWGTVIIKGGYYEHTENGTFWRGPGSIRTRKSTDMHWLELKDGEPCWTLFWHGYRRRTWGFKTEHGWMNYRTFLENRAKSKT
jgi:hypothetical protein